MIKSKFFLTFAVMAVIAGCTTPQAIMRELPIVSHAAKPPVPDDSYQDLTTYLTIEKQPTLRKEGDVINRENFRVKQGARVVINIPIEQQLKEKQRMMREERQPYYLDYRTSQKMNAERAKQEKKAYDEAGKVGKSDAPEAEKIEGVISFSTASFFSKAEQEIEKSLIRKGFNVVDRSKFEAKLRDNRTRKVSSESRAMEAEIALLEEKRDLKRITSEEYVTQLRDLKNKYEVLYDEEETGNQARRTHLTDISELIRAAQTGDVNDKADYILQVNNFKIDQISEQRIYLADKDEIRQLLRDHPSLRNAFEQKGMMSIARPGYYGYLNAKLIDVKDGAIVWVGELRVDSSNINKIDITVPVFRKLSNEATVNQTVAEYNARIDKLAQDGASYRRLINKLNESTYLGEDELARRQNYLNNYNHSYRELARYSTTPFTAPTWKYVYEIEAPRTPMLYSYSDLERFSREGKQNEYRKAKEEIERHYFDLAEKVARELINTIGEHY